MPSQAQNYWETNPKAAIASQWVSNPIIAEAIHQRMSGGKSTKYWLAWLVEDYFQNQTFDSLISLGCGIGNHEICLAKLGLANRIDAFDFSQASIKIAQQDAQTAGVTVNFYQDDFNNFTLPDNQKYDIAFCSGSLHHVKELERFLDIVSKSLKSDGYFIVNEYVGDCYNIYNQRQLELVNRLFNCFPDELKSGKMSSLINPTIAQVFASDPSEAVRSKLIMPFLEYYFKIEACYPFGGFILHPLYPLLDHNQFVVSDRKTETIIKLLLEFESILMELPGGFPTDFCLCILRPK